MSNPIACYRIIAVYAQAKDAHVRQQWLPQ